MKVRNLLVVDDDSLIHQTLGLMLEKPWQLISRRDANIQLKENIDAAFVDIHLSGDIEKPDGLNVIHKIRAQYPHLEIVAISGQLDRDLMENCLVSGASRFLGKPLRQDEVRLVLEKIDSLLQLQEPRQPHGRPQWIGHSAPAKKVLRQISDFKNERGPILIYGESGTGKEVVADLLNQQDQRNPFIRVNLAAIPENLFESEMFGHARGAFTGAQSQKMGLIEAAEGGDLFLDEIEALPLDLQAKLLRFLESGEFRRVGSVQNLHANVRVLAASNLDLSEMVKNNKFREDLLWRLSSKIIQLPPLRERPDDVAPLAKHFLSNQKTWKKEWGADAMALLQKYPWPGNVRELRRVTEQAALKSPLPVIRADDVKGFFAGGHQPMAHSAFEIDAKAGLVGNLERFEAFVVSQALQQQSDIDKAAKVLKISRSSLYKKIKDFKINWRE